MSEKESEASIRGMWAAPEPPAPKDRGGQVITEYIVIGDATLPVGSSDEIAAALAALAAAGINSASVWRSPHALDWIREHGDPDGVRTHLVVLASRDVDPVANGTASEVGK